MTDARESQTTFDVRSVLGLVQYCEKVKHDMTTVSETLAILTKKSETFKWDFQQGFKADVKRLLR